MATFGSRAIGDGKVDAGLGEMVTGSRPKGVTGGSPVIMSGEGRGTCGCLDTGEEPAETGLNLTIGSLGRWYHVAHGFGYG